MEVAKDTIVETLILTNPITKGLKLEDLGCQIMLITEVLVMLMRVDVVISFLQIKDRRINPSE